MAQHLSRHLWNAAIFGASALVALAANRVAAAPARPAIPAVADVAGLGDVGQFVGREAPDSVAQGYFESLTVDPFAYRPTSVEQSGVAPSALIPTVPSSPAERNRLTAILVADDRRVAVVDDAMVSVGDVLPDGARVSAIQPDRVWVVDRIGRWRMLTLTNRGAK
jgi:hypothetical protein